MFVSISILRAMEPQSPEVISVPVRYEQKDSRFRRFLNATSVISAFTLSVFCMTIALVNFKQSVSEATVANQSFPIHPKVNKNGTLQIISRDEWLARPSRNISRLELPVPLVVLGNTATEDCSTKAICLLRVNQIQSLHMEVMGWDDIAYNFLIGNDGYVYEGRGWDVQGAHTKGFNNRSVGISFLGLFESHLPHERAFVALKMLLEDGILLRKISRDFVIHAQRQLRDNLGSPGQKLFEWIMSLDKWKEYSQ